MLGFPLRLAAAPASCVSVWKAARFTVTQSFVQSWPETTDPCDRRQDVNHAFSWTRVFKSECDNRLHRPVLLQGNMEVTYCYHGDI